MGKNEDGMKTHIRAEKRVPRDSVLIRETPSLRGTMRRAASRQGWYLDIFNKNKKKKSKKKKSKKKSKKRKRTGDNALSSDEDSCSSDDEDLPSTAKAARSILTDAELFAATGVRGLDAEPAPTR